MLDLFKKPELLLWAVPLLPLVGFLINGLFGRRLNLAASGGVASASVIVSFLCAAGLFVYHMKQGSAAISSSAFTWMNTGGFHINFALLLDHLSCVYMLVITGVGSLIHIYSVGYMSHDEGFARYFAYLNLFVFSMLMLVLGDSLVTLFLGWEGVGLCSYLLIGFWYKDRNNAIAGKKAFVANRIGDFGFMIGMFLIFWHFGTLSYTGLLSQAGAIAAADTTLLNAACICLFIGACGKSAQIPLYVWLPDAMAGPTPVSALIHAATMVTAGIYMVARMNFVFVHAELAMDIVAIVGGVTALFAGSIGLVQRDIKKVLAYSTVSQLGFMFMAAGLGAFHIAVFHVFTHAFFKALLFLGSGSVIHALEHSLGHGNPDSQDMWKMGGLKEKMPITCYTMFIGSLALAGIPVFAGFFSKDAILYTAFHRGDGLGWLIYGLGVAAAVCTAFYSARLMGLTFFGKWRGNEHAYAHADESPRSMTMPLMVLAVLAILAGWLITPAAWFHFTPFSDWLAPTWNVAQATLPAESHFRLHAEHDAAAITAEWINMLISSVIAIGVFVFAFLIYKTSANIEKVKKLAFTGEGDTQRMTPWYKLLLNKYYVDEIYEKFVIGPVRIASDVLFVVVDVIVIDLLLVNGSAMLVKASSDLGRRLQTGLVRHYLYAFAVGMVVLSALFLLIAGQK
ncbi:MAG: NADH-quinone oxidoreductase subunit L [Planctomycetes bacterium]|nr:NADH-quinone oxidoreductase subunit L [Planctomycetota bacterium]MCB9934169.1 NADH-quinone oxidoreductase subunit L [Planctomycetota bacterium]